jgi:hypothetical protein
MREVQLCLEPRTSGCPVFDESEVTTGVTEEGVWGEASGTAGLVLEDRRVEAAASGLSANEVLGNVAVKVCQRSTLCHRYLIFI